MKRLEAKIHGKVIGVFYRANAANQAESIGGITGFVRNSRKEGIVEIVAEGSEENLKKFLEWCRKGPLHARVEKVDAEWKEASNKFKKFEIEY